MTRCEECGQELKDPNDTGNDWSVVIGRVQFGNGKKKDMVLAEGVSKNEAERIAHEYTATGHKATVIRKELVSKRTWKAAP